MTFVQLDAADVTSAALVEALATGRDGPGVVAELAGVAMRALAEGAGDRVGPLPSGGPAAVRATLLAAMVGGGRAAMAVLPEYGVGAERALDELRALAAGSADPAHPWCAGHLHGPVLAVAAAADLATSVLNPSLDSWDQAPSASALEAEVAAELAALVYPRATAADALITSGGTESNLVALLLARERGATRPVCGVSAHHSVARAAWVLGLPAPVTVACARGRMRPDALDETLAVLPAPAVVVATAGSTGAGVIDPLADIAEVAERHGAVLHVDAAYGGAALLSKRLRGRLAGIERAGTVSLDLHKLGWQPIAAGVLAVADAGLLRPLATRADYLNAADDTEAGLPDLLGRSLRTSRRPDVVKIATTFRALGRAGLAAMIERCCATAARVAERVDAHPRLRLWEPPELSTVLLRPAEATDEEVAAVRRRLLEAGAAVVGRAVAPDADGTDRLWLKLTLLHPHASPGDYDGLLDLIADAAACGRPTWRLKDCAGSHPPKPT